MHNETDCRTFLGVKCGNFDSTYQLHCLVWIVRYQIAWFRKVVHLYKYRDY